MKLRINEFWVATCRGHHDGTKVTVPVTHDDIPLEPCNWTCICGVTRTFTTMHDCDRSALRHAYPTRPDRLQQQAALLFRTR
ncbi:hypothetical protein AB0N17_45740 [Streptomyces sp. NPDC051133]|uniref:hypothetical protein n=1 Tax=Streptomyces sp. NPDC051133 TaxID=3155521 RepID=UPI0034471724